MNTMRIRSDLFIDWLSLTIHISPSQHQSVKGALEHLRVAGELERIDDQYSEFRKGYRYAYRLMFDEDLFCAIQIEPYKNGVRFMRLEWNPNSAQRVCPEATTRLLQVLAECTPGDPMQLIANARITRIDLTFDLHRIALDSFFVHATLRKNYSGQYFQLHENFEPKGKLNARYIGKSDSGQYLLMYDKRLEAEMQQIRRNPRHRREDRSPSGLRRIMPTRTRFEMRLRKVGSWRQLRTLPNPFEKYTVVSYENLGGVRHDHHWKFFVWACQTRGVQAVLSEIKNPRERKKYDDALKLGEPPSWWNPSLIQAELPAAIYRVFGTEMGT